MNIYIYIYIHIYIYVRIITAITAAGPKHFSPHSLQNLAPLK